MADKKISELPASSALDTDDLLAVVEDGVTVKATVQDLLDLAPSGNGIPTVINVVSDYGAVGDGVTNDRDAIQDALDAAAVTGGTVFLPAGTYLIKRPVFIDSNVTLQGAGRGVAVITKPASVKSVLTANASAAATSVTVTSSTGFEIGGAIHLSDTTSWEWLSTQGVITNIAGNVITFTNDEGLGGTGLDGALQTSNAATAYTTFPLLRNVQGATNVQVKNLTLDHNKGAGDPLPTSSIVNGMADFTLGTIHWVEAYYAVVENVEILDAPCDAYSDQANNGNGFTPTAAGIIEARNTIRDCRIADPGRHGVHIGTAYAGATVDSNIITGAGWYGYFFCAYSTYGTAVGNVINDCYAGFGGGDDRDVGNVISGNVIRGCKNGIEFNNTGSGSGDIPQGLTITGNTIIQGDHVSAAGITSAHACTNITGNNIHISEDGELGVSLLNGADRSVISNNIITRTTAASGSVGMQIVAVDDVRVTGNMIHTVQNGINIQGCLRLIADGNSVTNGSARGYYFSGTASDQCVIDNYQGSLAAWSANDTAPTLTKFNNYGSNGANNPASAGEWNAITGSRWDGTLVRWTSGSGERISVYYDGVGWTALQTGPTVNTVAAAGSTETLAGDRYSIHDVTLDENVTFTFSTSATVAQFSLILRQDGSGTNTVTWPGSVKWHSLTAPTILTSASAVHVLEFLTVDAGSTWRGFLASSAAS